MKNKSLKEVDRENGRLEKGIIAGNVCVKIIKMKRK